MPEKQGEWLWHRALFYGLITGTGALLAWTGTKLRALPTHSKRNRWLFYVMVAVVLWWTRNSG